MKIKLGVNTEPVKKLTKHPTFSIEKDCVFKNYNGVSDRTPSIQLSGNATDFKDFNYCYINGYGYYFIIDRISIRNGLTELSLSLDKMMTYNKEIKESSGIVERSEAFYNYYMEDPFVTCLGYLSLDCKNTKLKLTDGKAHYLAIVMGE